MCWFSSYFRQGNGRNFCGSCGSFCENYRLGQLSGGHLSRVQMSRQYSSREIIRGGNNRGRGVQSPRGQLSRGQFYSGAIVRAAVIQGAVFLGGNFPDTASRDLLSFTSFIYKEKCGIFTKWESVKEALSANRFFEKILEVEALFWTTFWTFACY